MFSSVHAVPSAWFLCSAALCNLKLDPRLPGCFFNNPCQRGMLNKSLPQGLFQPLEEGDRQDQVWTPQMRLTKDSPSWMWKKTRLHLASADGRNKAGRKKGAGCTSKARKEKRMGIPPKDSPDREEWDEKKEWEEKGWWWNPWKKGWVWWGKDEEEEDPRNRDRSPVRLRSTSNRRRNYANRGRSSSSSRSNPRNRGRSSSSSRSNPRNRGSRSQSQRPTLVWQKRSWARSRRKSHLPALAQAQNPWKRERNWGLSWLTSTTPWKFMMTSLRRTRRQSGHSWKRVMMWWSAPLQAGKGPWKWMTQWWPKTSTNTWKSVSAFQAGVEMVGKQTSAKNWAAQSSSMMVLTSAVNATTMACRCFPSHTPRRSTNGGRPWVARPTPPWQMLWKLSSTKKVSEEGGRPLQKGLQKHNPWNKGIYKPLQ